MQRILLTLIGATGLILSDQRPALPQVDSPKPSTQTMVTNPVPLSVELLDRIRNSLGPDLSVSTTNRDAVSFLVRPLLDGSTAEPQFAVLKPLDNLNVNSRYLVVPWNLLQYDPRDKRIEIRATRTELQEAPLFTAERLPETAPLEWRDKVNTYFGQSRIPVPRAPGPAGVNGTVDVSMSQPKNFWPIYLTIFGVFAVVMIAVLARHRSPDRKGLPDAK
jgi:hypothetical protein